MAQINFLFIETDFILKKIRRQSKPLKTPTERRCLGDTFWVIEIIIKFCYDAFMARKVEGSDPPPPPLTSDNNPRRSFKYPDTNTVGCNKECNGALEEDGKCTARGTLLINQRKNGRRSGPETPVHQRRRCVTGE